MGKDKNRFGTFSDMSVGDVLKEVQSGAYKFDTNEFDLEDVLAEFSDLPVKEKNDSFFTDPKIIKEEVQAEVKKAQTPKKTENKKEKESEKEKKKETVDTITLENNDKIKRVDTIIRPWENGVYGDMTLDEPEENTVKEKKKRKKISLSETFDTFTRSELFEEKIQERLLETRPVEEIIQENRQISKLFGLRTIALLFLSLLSLYIAFSAPLEWFFPSVISYIQHPFRYLFLTAFLQILAMLLSIDIISKGMSRLFELHPNMESAITFSSFATLIHVVSVMIAPQWRGWLPYSAISVVTLFFAMYAKWINARSLCRVCKIVKSAKEPSIVYLISRYDETNIIKQTTDDTRSFISHINDKDAARTFWTYLSPLVIVASIVFAAISSFGTRTPEHFFWALSAISSVSTPFFIMLSFAHPFSVVTKRLSTIGAAISGWYSSKSLSKRANFVVCDEDIFPKGTITLHGLRILGSFSLEQTVCYAASVIAETKSGLSGVFTDLLKSRYAETTTVKNLQYHESGGLEAQIGDDSVIVGSVGFMLRSGVRIESSANARNAVFIAINKEPAGVFNVNYKASVEVERALQIMVKKKVPVVLAVRDFNLLPMMIEKAFDLPDGSMEYPEIEQRIDLSSDEQFINEDACAVVTRSGLSSYSFVVLEAKKLRRATIRNICLTALSTVIGMLLMFYLTFIQKPNLIPPHTVFVYMMMWMVPTYMLSARVKK